MRNWVIVFFFLLIFFQVDSISVTENYLPKPYRNHQGTLVLPIDDFEDAELLTMPAWWAVGDAALLFEEHDPPEPLVGKHSLLLQGKTSDWMIGGLGTYLGMDARRFTALKLMVYGNGEESGVLVFQLFDDDNQNSKIEVFPDLQLPSEDDCFVYTLKVNWDGWRTLIIALDQFRDHNVGIGDDIWNPYQEQGSGGLIQMQIIGMSNQASGIIHVGLDNLKFYSESRSGLFDLPYIGAPPRVISDEDEW